MKTKFYWIGALTSVIVIMMIYSAISTPGISELEGNFKEIAFARNEQNSGPVMRVYIVVLDGKNIDEIEQYGNYLPHTKYGKTTVYFFDRNGEYPKSFEGLFEIPPTYKVKCIALYEKDGMGQVSIIKDPYESFK